MFTRYGSIQWIALAAALVLAVVAFTFTPARTGIAAHPPPLFDDPDSPVAGNPQGDVTLVEFFDYRCIYCKRMLSVIAAVIEEDPGVRVVFKEYPIFGRDSMFAARAALASRNQDPAKYLAFHRALMSHRGSLSESTTLAIARDLGFDAERIKADMNAPAITEAIARNHAVAREIGITGTPNVVVGSHLVPGAVDARFLRDLIAQTRDSLPARLAQRTAN